ncbi:isochorismatase family protein, partial [Candidatus Woesearchaeota archaeon]|nr:isochorismatase family protein [Candidatus Woesearchaeota archaeon]
HPKCEIKNRGISFKKIRKMVPKLARFIERYKKKTKNPVIYVNCVPWDKKHLAKNIVELYKDPKCRYYSKDKSGFSEKFFMVEPGKDDLIFTKNHYDAFTNQKLVTYLKKKKIKFLIVAGIFGDGCVNATINGGFSKGFNFVILKDLIETTDEKIRQDLQNLMKKYVWPVMYGRTINSKEFLK